MKYFGIFWTGSVNRLCLRVKKIRIEITILATCKVTLFTMEYFGIFWHESINHFFLIFGLIILSYTQRIAKIGLPKWKILA